MQLSPNILAVSTPTSSLTPNPSTPSYSDDYQWVTAYLTIHSLTNGSRVYSYILWIAVGVLVLLFSIVHSAGMRGGYFGAFWSKWSLRRRTWRKKHKLTMAIKRGEPHKQPSSLPSNAQILSLTVLVIGSLALAYIGPDYYAPGSQFWNVHSTPTASIKRAALDPSVLAQYQAQYTIPKAWWTSAARTGQIAFALFPLCVLFALKAPPFAIFSISFLTQLYFDKLSWLHKWCGTLVWFLSTLHVVSWSVQLAKDHRNTTGKVAYSYAWQYEKFIYGWIAYAALTLILVCSLPPIRRHHYEAFWFLHVLFVPIALILAALHHPPVWWWCWAALALWIGERIYRLTWYLHTNGFFGGMPASVPQTKLKKKPSKKGFTRKIEALQLHTLNVRDKSQVQAQAVTYPSASSVHQLAIHMEGYVPPPGFFHADLLPGRTVRLRLITPGFLSWAPGQHFLISIPSISRFTSHPFTAASICDGSSSTNDGRELVFLIRAKKGWTKDLWDTVAVMTAHGQKHPSGESLPVQCELPARGVLMRGLVDGPFGSSARTKWGEFSSVLVVTGGSGISFGLSILEYICLCLAGRDGKHLGGHPGGYGKPGFRTSRVRFVWLVREFGHIQWCASALRRCMALVPPSELQVDIFVTNVKPTLRAPLAPQNLEQRLPSLAGEDGLVPPSPQFARESQYSSRSDKRRSRSPSVSSLDSSDDESVESMVDLSYYAGDFVEEEQDDEHVLDLTNFDGDDDTAIPGEEQLNLSVKKEGKRRRSVIRRASMVLAAKQELENRSSIIYNQATAPSSSVRLIDPRPSSYMPPSLEPISEHIQSASSSQTRRDIDLRSPITASDLQTPTSAVGLLANENKFAFPPPPSFRPSAQQQPSQPSSPSPPGSPTRPTSSRPTSMLSQMTGYSDANSFVALVSDASLREQLRLEVDESELADISVVAEHARPGKPRLDRILADEVQRSKGPVVVGCCGPTSLNALLRKNIAAQIDPARIRGGDLRGSISFVAEDFGY